MRPSIIIAKVVVEKVEVSNDDWTGYVTRSSHALFNVPVYVGYEIVIVMIHLGIDQL
jgi:hypothetical protein